MPGIVLPPFAPPPSAGGSNINLSHIGQALWNVMKVIGTPNKNSDVGNTLGMLANQAKSPMNMAMMFGGGGSDMMGGSPLEGASWIEPYNLIKPVGTGQVAFKEGQPYSVQGDLNRVKTMQILNKINRTRPNSGLPQMTPEGFQATREALQRLHDAMFGGETWLAPHTSQIPPRP